MFQTSARVSTESSMMLWMLAAAVATFAAYVCMGWLREAQRAPAWRERWPGLLFSAGSMGAGISACMVLSLSSQALSYPLGYPLLRAVGLWPLSMLLCLPACALLIHSQGLLAKMGGGLMLAAAGGLTQAAWLDSVGFRPGILWRTEFIVAAGVVLVFGLTSAVAVAQSHAAREGSRRRMWRVAGAAMGGLTLLAGQEVLMAGAGLLKQVGSVYKNHVPAPLVCLVAGVVVPLVLTVMAVDLALRRRVRRRRGSRKAAAERSQIRQPWGTEFSLAAASAAPASAAGTSKSRSARSSSSSGGSSRSGSKSGSGTRKRRKSSKEAESQASPAAAESGPAAAPDAGEPLDAAAPAPLTHDASVPPAEDGAVPPRPTESTSR